MTYRQVDQLTNQLARFLRTGFRQEAEPSDTCVAIILPKSMELYLFIIATLKAGAAYVPLDPSFPADRIAFVLGDAHVDTVVTSSKLNLEKFSTFLRPIAMTTTALTILITITIAIALAKITTPTCYEHMSCYGV